jgi:hypothetical protein
VAEAWPAAAADGQAPDRPTACAAHQLAPLAAIATSPRRVEPVLVVPPQWMMARSGGRTCWRRKCSSSARRSR